MEIVRIKNAPRRGGSQNLFSVLISRLDYNLNNPMYVAVDETGYFKDKTGTEIGLVTLVSITDSEWQSFQTFAQKVIPEGIENTKGKLLTDDQRTKLMKYIGKKQEIKYTSYLYDLSGGSDQWVNFHRAETIKRAEKNITAMGKKLKPTYVSDIRLLLRQLNNLSVSDYSKFVMFTEIIIGWQQYFQFDYVFTHTSRDSWIMNITVDMQNQPQKFIRLIQSMLILTTNERNPNYGIYTPKEWGSDHPFIKRHTVDNDMHRHNAREFYKDFKIGNEKENPILFLPDLIGYVIYTSILRQKQKKWLKLLKRIKPNRSLTITTKHKSGFYHITGFDKSKNPRKVNPAIKSHWNSVASL